MILPVSIVLFVDGISSSGLSLWMQKRVEDGPLNGLWEFPGGKIESNETSEEAGRREVHEEVGLVIPEQLSLPLFKRHQYDKKEKTIILHVHLCHFNEIPLEKGQWFFVDYIQKSAPLRGKIPQVNHEFIDLLLDYMQRQYNAGTLEMVWQKS